jgi:hypothetical protein
VIVHPTLVVEYTDKTKSILAWSSTRLAYNSLLLLLVAVKSKMCSASGIFQSMLAVLHTPVGTHVYTLKMTFSSGWCQINH